MDNTGKRINGAKIANHILNDLKPKVDQLKKQGVNPTLAIILVGDNQASRSYIKQKQLKADDIGVFIKLIQFDNISESELLDKIHELNIDENIHGIIVQRPLPHAINKEEVSRAISIEKDVDGFNDESTFDAPVALAVLEILKEIHVNELNNYKITILGKGETAGKPIIKLFDKNELNFNVIDSKTTNNDEIIRDSDIIISAVGKENIIDPDNLNSNQILIGVGLALKNGKLIGDYGENEIVNKVNYYTPRIGGVGPVNVAFLMKNLIQAASSSTS